MTVTVGREPKCRTDRRQGRSPESNLSSKKTNNYYTYSSNEEQAKVSVNKTVHTVISEEIIRQGKQNNENMEVCKEHKE